MLWNAHCNLVYNCQAMEATYVPIHTQMNKDVAYRGSFIITVSISILVISLFIFSVSSCFSLGRLFISKNLSSYSRLSVLLASCLQLLVIVSYDSFYFQGVCCNFFFIYLFINLSPFLFFLMTLAKGLSTLFIF